ncbi:hypothetical protein DB42_BD00240 [Neochlamydia sp. EPS4]|nr:hypothetical protein DB42_BD00240 [Neochlamydia sp. EPS4]
MGKASAILITYLLPVPSKKKFFKPFSLLLLAFTLYILGTF